MTPRKRTALPSGIATAAGQKLMLLVAVGLVYAGAVALALAAGVHGDDLERISGAGWLHDRLAELDPSTWSRGATATVAALGVLLAVLLLRLAWAQRLVPQRTRTAFELSATAPAAGRTTVQPRAIERAAEVAAAGDPGVRAAKATLGDGDLTVHLHARDAARLPEILRDAERRTRAALHAAGVGDDVGLRLTITRFSAPSRTELLR